MSLVGTEGQFGEMSKFWDDRVMAGHLNMTVMVNSVMCILIECFKEGVLISWHQHLGEVDRSAWGCPGDPAPTPRLLEARPEHALPSGSSKRSLPAWGPLTGLLSKYLKNKAKNC